MQKLEHILGLDQVIAYLTEQHPHLAPLCQIGTGCHLWQIEERLLTDLTKAKQQQPAQKTSINHLRALLRAVSWRTHERASTSALLLQAHWLQEQANKLKDAAGKQHAREIIQCFNQSLSGAAAEPATQAIEIEIDQIWQQLLHQKTKSRWDWATLESAYAYDLSATIQLPNRTTTQLNPILNRLHRLRLLRDALYFRRLYPSWFALAKEE